MYTDHRNCIRLAVSLCGVVEQPLTLGIYSFACAILFLEIAVELLLFADTCRSVAITSKTSRKYDKELN